MHQTNYLLDQQIRALEDRFVREGGYREQLLKRRLDYRKNSR
ncbi:MAG: four helix bundle suffix domain-containing protein [Patescibacteria group bacterium]